MAPGWCGWPAPAARRNDPARAPGLMDADGERGPADDRIGRVSTPATMVALPRPRESFLRTVGVVGRLSARRHVADLYPEPVPVRRVDGDGEPETVVFLVEANPVDLKNRDAPVRGKLEEPDLVLVGRAHRDRVAIAGLLDPALFGEVGDGPAADVGGFEQPGRAALHQDHRIERGLQRPRRAVDEPLLVPADHRGTFLDPQAPGHRPVGFLDLH